MPFLGVYQPAQRRVFRSVFSEHPLASFDEWRDTVLALWRGARYREERYAAIALAEAKAYAAFRTPAALPLYEELVVTGAWWDYVDWIATHLIRELLVDEPRRLKPIMRSWSRSDDVWKRRSAILSQVGLKERTDVALPYACIEPSLGEREFFLRKAIGWALRDYSKTDPAEIVRYVQEHEDRLSPLSRREALKHTGTAVP